MNVIISIRICLSYRNSNNTSIRVKLIFLIKLRCSFYEFWAVHSKLGYSNWFCTKKTRKRWFWFFNRSSDWWPTFYLDYYFRLYTMWRNKMCTINLTVFCFPKNKQTILILKLYGLIYRYPSVLLLLWCAFPELVYSVARRYDVPWNGPKSKPSAYWMLIFTI